VIKKILNTYNNSRFLNTKINGTEHHLFSSENKTGTCELISVTYNNAELVKHQFSLLKKHFKGNFNFLIADNSSDSNIRKEISDYCKRTNISYVSLPLNPYKTGSQSHAAALNWVLKNYILERKPAYFGFIDHDIFPIEPFSIEEILKKQPVYGLLQQREQLWYLWAGFCFFNFNSFDCAQMDFMPGTVNGINLDTGGKNWNLVYSNINRDSIEFPLQTYKNLRAGDVAQSDKLEIIGKWVHSFNGSYWMKVDKKEDLLEKYLKQYM
jgi:hypothetical protein